MIAVMSGRTAAKREPQSQTESLIGVSAIGNDSPRDLAKSKPDFEKKRMRTKQSPRLTKRSKSGLACSYSPAELQKNKNERGNFDLARANVRDSSSADFRSDSCSRRSGKKRAMRESAPRMTEARREYMSTKIVRSKCMFRPNGRRVSGCVKQRAHGDGCFARFSQYQPAVSSRAPGWRMLCHVNPLVGIGARLHKRSRVRLSSLQGVAIKAMG